MDESNRRKLEPPAVYGRKPDTDSVYKSPEPYRKKWWEKEKRAEPPAMPIGQSKTGTLDKYVPDNGILDSLFAGLEMEAEIARVAKLMDDVK